MAASSHSEGLATITNNLAEVLNVEILEGVLAEGRSPKIYWGTATTGRPHLGYLVPGVKIAEFLRAGCEVKILLADIHGFLDNLKAPLELVQHRACFYKFAITAMLEAVGVATDRLEFVLGSSYQRSEPYVMDVYKLCSLTSEHDAKKAGAEIVKQTSNAPLSGLLYPILQVLDEQCLDVDAQFGGVDQRKLFTAATEWLPKLGYRMRAHLLNPMVPGLQGGKMSSSEENSKIDLLDEPDTVAKKLRKAECAPRIVDGNGVLAFVKFVILPIAALKGREFRVERDRDGLEPLTYTSIDVLHDDYKNDVLTPQLLKAAVTREITELMAPILAKFKSSSEWQVVTALAYPTPEKKVITKKAKNRGTGFPTGPKAKAKVDGGNLMTENLPIRTKEATETGTEA
jgi:tyrosyl-tRNA synthetase